MAPQRRHVLRATAWRQETPARTVGDELPTVQVRPSETGREAQPRTETDAPDEGVAAAAGKTVLFVGTKKQAIQAIKDSAEKCGMPYVNSRWLGGMMTNFGTIKQSIRKLEVIEAMEEDGSINLLTKKEALMLRRKKEKLEEVLGGIRNMKNLPDMIFVIDTVKEKIAVAEANKLKIEIVAPVDTNCDPDLITYPVPANDDAIRAVQLFCNEMAEAINEGKAMMDPEVAVANEEAISEAEKQEVLEEAMSEEE